MHGAALAELARADRGYADWSYCAVDAEPEALAEALAVMHRLGFRGVNLTVPHKVLAVALVSEIDPAAAEAGAVNTLVRQGSGWKGYNTDGYGLASGIREDLGLALRNQNILLLGAGGAARGAALECIRSGCASLRVMNRSRENLDSLLAQVLPFASGIPVSGMGPGDARTAIPEGPLVINATSLGLKPGDGLPADLARLPPVSAVYDMIYNPAETALLAQARSMGVPAANGLGMLVHQGAKALEIWSGVPAARTSGVMRSAAAKALGSGGAGDSVSRT